MPHAATHPLADAPAEPGRDTLLRHARELYPDGPALPRLLQHHRPRICPFGALLARVPPGASVLDVGCGSGLFLGLAAKTGRLGRGRGFDAAEEPILMARAMQERLNHPDLVFEHRAVQAGMPEGEHDVVSMIDVLHHVPPADQRSAIVDAAQRVRPGGVFLYKDMCRRPVWRAQMNRLHDLTVAHQWIHYAPVADVERWAGEAGLVLERAEWHARWWYGHELRAFRRPGGAA